jgi:hypothetical protein
VPQDINLDPFAKSASIGGVSPKVDKPSSPQDKRTVLDSQKLSSPKSVSGSPGAGGAPTSPICAASGQDPVGISSVLEQTKSPKASPPSPQSHGHRAT